MKIEFRVARVLGALSLSLALVAPAAEAASFVYTADVVTDNISGFRINPATGALTPLAGSPFAAGGEAEGVALAPSGRFLYAALSDTGTVAVFAVEATTGALTPVGSPVPSGLSTFHVIPHPSGRFVYASNNGSNSISAYRVNFATGSLTPVAGSPFATGGSPWQSAIDASGRFFYVANITSNSVSAYSINKDTGVLTPVAGSPFPTGGTNAYGLSLAPSGFLYVSHSSSADLRGFSINPTTGALTSIGAPVACGAACMQTTVDPSGRFVYTANANPSGTVSGFGINPSTGTLTPIAGSPFPGGAPFGRQVVVDLTGRFLYEYMQDTNSAVYAFEVNGSTGSLAPVPGSPFATSGIFGWGLTTGRNFTRGDFNSDGLTDILWRHDVSGENVLWYMNGTVLTTGTFTSPAALADVRWKMVGTPDLNLDRESDILWRHDVSGENVIWYMNGNALVAGTFLTPAALTDTDWKMAGTGDFNGDGQFDIAWHHRVAGQVAIWYMNGSVLQGGTFTSPSGLADASWKVVGVADFNHDLRPDLLWRHDISGQILVWYMADSVRTAETLTTPSALADTDWKLVAVGDYNSDRKNDFVWRHGVAGENVVWFMDGVTLISGTLTTPGTLADTNWKMVGPR